MLWPVGPQGGRIFPHNFTQRNEREEEEEEEEFAEVILRIFLAHLAAIADNKTTAVTLCPPATKLIVLNILIEFE